MSTVHTAKRIVTSEVTIPCDGVTLPGTLDMPEEARGLVVFAHGSGSSRRSRRNRIVASMLLEAGLATLLFDLLTEAEASDRHNVFDIPLLSVRVLSAVRWAGGDTRTARCGIGLFGASTGAAAALVAAAREPAVRAVVSRGGRPDLAGGWLEHVYAPTLLIVGGLDTQVLRLNREAFRQLPGARELAVVPGATHLFEEPDTLEHAAALARDWFERHLGARTQD